MTENFGRTVYVQIGPEGGEGREFRDLAISFDIKHTLTSAPNEGTVEIVNPSDNSVALAQTDDAVVRVFAGYDTPRLIFEGSPKDNGVSLKYEHPDTVLEIDALDGGRALARSRVNVSIGGPVSAEKILEIVASELGLPRGVVEVPEPFELDQGITIDAQVSDVLDRLAKSTGANASIQNGSLQLIPKDGDKQVEVSSFSRSNGNLISVDRKDEGIEVTAQLDGTLRPGDRCEVDDDRGISGIFKARDVKFKGDNWSGKFIVQFTATEASQ